MAANDTRDKLLALLCEIAPDITPENVDPDRNLRDQFDFDSMDALHFATAISESFGIDIAETDYPRLANLRDAEAFVQERAHTPTQTR